MDSIDDVKKFLENGAEVATEDTGDAKIVINIDQIFSPPEGQQFFDDENQITMQQVLNRALEKLQFSEDFKELLGREIEETRGFMEVSHLVDPDFEKYMDSKNF